MHPKFTVVRGRYMLNTLEHPNFGSSFRPQFRKQKTLINRFSASSAIAPGRVTKCTENCYALKWLKSLFVLFGTCSPFKNFVVCDRCVIIIFFIYFNFSISHSNCIQLIRKQYTFHQFIYSLLSCISVYKNFRLFFIHYKNDVTFTGWPNIITF